MATGEQRTTALLLVQGRFRIELSTGSFVLEREGITPSGGRASTTRGMRKGLRRDYGSVALPVAVGARPPSLDPRKRTRNPSCLHRSAALCDRRMPHQELHGSSGVTTP